MKMDSPTRTLKFKMSWVKNQGNRARPIHIPIRSRTRSRVKRQEQLSPQLWRLGSKASPDKLRSQLGITKTTARTRNWWVCFWIKTRSRPRPTEKSRNKSTPIPKTSTMWSSSCKRRPTSNSLRVLWAEGRMQWCLQILNSLSQVWLSKRWCLIRRLTANRKRERPTLVLIKDLLRMAIHRA
jgi:hypothetical protein